MDFRRISQLVLLCLTICSQTFAQGNQGNSFLFQLPGAGSGSTRLLGYLADTNELNADLDTTTGPLNARQILATPDGQRFYVVAENSVQYFNATLQTLQPLGIAGPIRSAVLTPDGKYLMIAAANFYIINTSNNVIAATNLGVSGDLVDFAVSPDSAKAWLLQRFSFGGAITPINLSDLSAGTRMDISRGGDTIAYSPQGKLYVPSQNVITEYDATTLENLNETIMSALPGRLHFNRDGSMAYFVDKTPTQGYGIVSYNTANHNVFGWPANVFDLNRPIFEDIYMVNDDHIFGFDKGKTSLWDITTNPLDGALVNYSSAFASNIVFAAAVSNEIPSARFLYVLTEESARTSLERISLADGSRQILSNAATSAGVLQYVAIPPQTGASQILKYNDNQVVAAGAQAQTLFAYVTDSLGRPVFNQTVNFTANGLTLTKTSAQTNANGYVEATATMPAEPGNYNVVLTAGTATATWVLTVPATGDGGGEPGTTSRMTKVRGDGQLIVELHTNPFWAPLTVKVVDENGDPLGGIPVEYTVTAGTGIVLPQAFETDDEGLIASTFFAQNVPGGNAFEQNVVRATSAYGSVEFLLTVLRLNPNQSGLPQIPSQSFFEATVTRGDVIPNFYQTSIISSNFPQIGEPIPGVGLRVADGEDISLDGLGTCVNDTRSDNLGVARCDFQASCSLVNATPIQIVIGETLPNKILLFPLPGTQRKFNYIAGNTQTGNVGQTLNGRLIASITDNCGDAVAGQDVVWTVTQGTATLSQTISRSGNDGNVSTLVTLGQTAGEIQITLSLENATPLIFTVTANVTVSSMGLTSGGGQSVLPGQTFPNPVVFTLRTANGTPVGANVNVSFALSGGGTISPVQATTNAQGQVQTTVTAGNSPGTLTLTATTANLSASATLTINTPSLPLTPASFANAASGATGLVPCGLATAVGAGLAPNINGVVSGSPFGNFGPYLTTVNNTSLTVNGVLAPILAISNQDGKQQINFQTPCQATPGTATVVVTVNGVATTVTGVPVFAAQPGLSTFTQNGKTYPVVVRAKDNSLIQANNLAPTGETLYLLYVTGLGLVTPSTGTNSNGQQNQTAVLPVVIGVNNAGVPTQPARYAFGQIGLYYVEFTIPKTSAPAGTVLSTDVPFALGSINNGQYTFGNSVLLPGVVQGQ